MSMSALLEFFVWRAAKHEDTKSTALKVDNRLFDKTIWLNLVDSEGKPDFDAQQLVSDQLRLAKDKGAHYRIWLSVDDIQPAKGDTLRVKMTFAQWLEGAKKHTKAERQVTPRDPAIMSQYEKMMAELGEMPDAPRATVPAMSVEDTTPSDDEEPY